MRGRTVLGTGAWNDTYGSVTYALGDVAGERMHQLTLDEMPKHNHSSNAISVAYPYWGLSQSNSFEEGAEDPDFLIIRNIATDYAGNSKAHNTMMPYTVIHWIMKT